MRQYDGFAKFIVRDENVARLSVDLTERDRARLKKIREEVPGIQDDVQALLWALRHVVMPETTVTLGVAAPRGGGGLDGGEKGSIVRIIPETPLDDTHMAPFEMHLDATILSPITGKSGKRVQIQSAELTRLRAIETQFVAVAQCAQRLILPE